MSGARAATPPVPAVSPRSRNRTKKAPSQSSRGLPQTGPSSSGQDEEVEPAGTTFRTETTTFTDG
ncbi:hypothetical protein C5E08_03405 [Rathayibacter iranicus]|uniref:Uncharacterized protein n=2 Tax=Rathayibacter iranicus TaxID=59737 RepID=A0AAD2JG26_9MICO|nr:hypothetical protein C7V51_03395 [Rathayibacter iranicus]PPI61946.1 hypothetical protein C5E08_03405 [Rathayibacter iranicus]PWJ61531.1 hypothetical protein B0H03_1163 [Rathayibacter iranicus NCPPB 2253 = VKM Ac-1602]